ncbi:MAG: hypothetical protein JWN49_86, partial [Parcubacteria group bacterium]|nr:hypothetical protein [Parcubacteria group bacterium]
MVAAPALGAGPFGGGGSSPLSSTLDFYTKHYIFIVEFPVFGNQARSQTTGG